MSNKTVLLIASAVMVAMFAILFADNYRRCIKAGYKDCPRIGKSIFADPKPTDPIAPSRF